MYSGIKKNTSVEKTGFIHGTSVKNTEKLHFHQNRILERGNALQDHFEFLLGSSKDRRN